MICTSCGIGYDSPITACPKCQTSASALAPRVGPFARGCLHIARIGALVNTVAIAAAGVVILVNGHYFVAALLVVLGVPISIGHFVAFGLLIEYAET